MYRIATSQRSVSILMSLRSLQQLRFAHKDDVKDLTFSGQRVTTEL